MPSLITLTHITIIKGMIATEELRGDMIGIDYIIAIIKKYILAYLLN